MNKQKYLRMTFGGVLAAALCAMGAGPAAAQGITPGPAAALQARVTLFKAIAGLKLGPDQIKDITQRLVALEVAQTDEKAKEAAALGPVDAQLQRMDAALAAGKESDPADLAAVSAALKPLMPARAAVDTLLKNTVTAIRSELTRGQMTEILRALEMDRDSSSLVAPPTPQTATPAVAPAWNGQAPAWNAQGGAPAPNFAGAAPGIGGPGPGGGGPGGWRGGGGGGGGNYGPSRWINRLMDRFRSAPDSRADQFVQRVAGRMAQRQGLDPNSPDYAAAKAAFMSQMDQIRAMPPDQYRAEKPQLVADVMKTMGIQNIGPNSKLQPRSAAEAALDDAAVRRFFVQPDSIQFLRIQAAHLPATPAPAK